MFDIGFWEILLILVLALIVIGPERLPGAARRAGYLVGKARRFIEGARTELESEFDVNELKRVLHNQEVQINELQQQLKTDVNELSAGMSENPQAENNTDTNEPRKQEMSDEVQPSITAANKEP